MAGERTLVGRWNNAHTPALAYEDSLVWLRSPSRSTRELNQAEVKIAGNIVIDAREAGVPAIEMAVVCPFRRQAAATRAYIEKALPGTKLPIIDTVEHVQGLTVEMVILSMTTSDSDYAAGLGAFLFSENRLNVALSWARAKAVLVCSQSILNVIPLDYAGVLGQNALRTIINRGSHL